MLKPRLYPMPTHAPQDKGPAAMERLDKLLDEFQALLVKVNNAENLNPTPRPCMLIRTRAWRRWSGWTSRWTTSERCWMRRASRMCLYVWMNSPRPKPICAHAYQDKGLAAMERLDRSLDELQALLEEGLPKSGSVHGTQA